jgi:DNA-binding transcriptional ArsR family regulator
MTNKAEILFHPVRMKISQALIRNRDKGLTPLEMVKIVKDVPQATLYRHIQVLLDAGIIRIVNEKKVRSVSERYYTLNEEAAKLNGEDWKILSKEDKLNYISYYQLTLLNQYQNYLTRIEENTLSEDVEDGATFSIAELKLNDKEFDQFQNELNDLMKKYYKTSHTSSKDSTSTRTVAITIIPES